MTRYPWSAEGTVAAMDGVAAKLAWRRLPWVVELASILFFYGVYSVVRVLAPHRLSAAYHNAAEVVSLENALHLPSELGLNQWITRHANLEIVASWYYVTAHYLVTTVVLVWLWSRRRRLYAPLRSALVLSSLSALVIYATWPLAPPRYAMAGTVDTVQDVLNQGHGVSGLVNDIAAMPSMHVGWALWCSVVVVAVLQHPARHLAWLKPVATTLVVVATANHYLLDAVGGVLVVSVPLYLVGLRPGRILTAAATSSSSPVTEPCAA